MRVMVVGQLPPPVHGSAVMTERLRDCLAGIDDFKVTVIDKRFSADASDVGRQYLMKTLRVPSLFVRTIRGSRGVDLCVYMGTNRGGSFLVDCLLLAVLRLRRIPVANYVHTVGYRNLAARGWVWRKAVAWFMAHTVCAISLSEALSSDLTPWMAESEITSIPNFVEEISPSDRPRERRMVVFLSNLLPDKGPFEFIDLAWRLQGECGEDFVLAGGSSDRDVFNAIKKRVADLGLRGRVQIPGAVSAESRQTLLDQCAVFVFPSRYPFEAQPLVVLEAMMAGVPVVATRVGALGDMVRDGIDGILVDPGDSAALSGAVLEILRDRDMRERMGRAAHDRATSYFSRHQFEKRWTDVVRQITRND